ncbi:MAG: hypothetical protein Q9157_000408 [Trypethelium eluteriae]
MNQASAHIPAWKRLGLKLKHAQETTSGKHESTGSTLATQEGESHARLGDGSSDVMTIAPSTGIKDVRTKKRRVSATTPSTNELDHVNGKSVLNNHRNSSPDFSPSQELQAECTPQSIVTAHEADSHINKKRKRHSEFSHVHGTQNGSTNQTAVTAQSSVSDRTDSEEGDISPTTRRKSVTFTSDTKTEDGNSAQKLFSHLVSGQADRTIAHDNQATTGIDPEHTNGHAGATENNSEAQVAARRAKKRKIRADKRGGSMTPIPPYVSYLQQFHTARDQWKFNKNQQNQLLKHMFNLYRVPERYDPAIESYIAGLQGLPLRERLRETAIGILKESHAALAQIDGPKENMDYSRRQRAREDALQRRLQDHDQRWEAGTTSNVQADGQMQALKRKRAQVVLTALEEDHPLYPVQAFVMDSTINDGASNGAEDPKHSEKRAKLDGQQRSHKRLRKQRRSELAKTDSSSGTSGSSSTDSSSEEEVSSSQSESTSTDSESESTSSGFSSTNSEHSSSSTGSRSSSGSHSTASQSGSETDSSESDEASDAESQPISDQRSTSSSSSSSH